MITEDKRVLVMELAYILHRRNTIEVRRRRAKNKIGYYEELKRVVKNYKIAVDLVAHLKRAVRVGQAHESELKKAEVKVGAFSAQKMKPFKWLNNISGLNKRILKHRAEYMKARYDAARLTCESRKRVARLTAMLAANINYQFGTGFVESIHVFRNTADQQQIPHTDFESMYREVEANKAIERMLRSNAKKDEENKT